MTWRGSTVRAGRQGHLELADVRPARLRVPAESRRGADLAYFTDVLGGRCVFAIDSMDTRVAMVALTDGPPRLLLAGHLEGDVPVLVYRVPDLEAAANELRARGWADAHALEIPQGPVRSFTGPGGHRLAIYQLHPSRCRGLVRGPSRLLACRGAPRGARHDHPLGHDWSTMAA